MAIITKSDRKQKDIVKVKTVVGASRESQGYYWWLGASKKERATQVVETAAFLKTQQQYRYRQASIHARMYGNLPLSNFLGNNMAKIGAVNTLPADRPTMNVVQSCVDTLVSRISQSKPKPVFLTDGGNYKQRKLAKQMNQFIQGELYRTGAYDMVPTMFRDSSILGSGCVKVYEHDNKVCLERLLLTELLVDINDGFYGNPRCMYQLKLVDRSVVKDLYPEYRARVEQAEQAYPDNGGDSQRTISDQIMLVEAWHLPSSEDAGDGKHIIACTAGELLDEEYTKDYFPFVFLHYSPRLVGFWGQGLAEQLSGTQLEINKILIQMSKSISLITPVWLIEEGSKMVKSHFNNDLGRLQTYRGTPPIYNAPEAYNQVLPTQLERLIQFAYQQSGISAMAATSQKPAGLNSGEAIRNYDDLQSDRFALTNKKYDNAFIELGYKIIDMAKDIATRTGKYRTIYPSKDAAQAVDFPKVELLENEYIIQCYDSSSLPKDPAGRLEKITEMMQAGIIDSQEGRRLLDFPDLSQVDKLAMAAEERIYKILDDIVDSSKYEPPDPYIDIQLAKKIVVQYYNLYDACGLEEKKLSLLRDWQSQLLTLEQSAMPPMPMAASASPQAVPEQRPTSPMLPQVQ